MDFFLLIPRRISDSFKLQDRTSLLRLVATLPQADDRRSCRLATIWRSYSRNVVVVVINKGCETVVPSSSFVAAGCRYNIISSLKKRFQEGFCWNLLVLRTLCDFFGSCSCLVVELIFCVNKSCLLINLIDFNSFSDMDVCSSKVRLPNPFDSVSLKTYY